MRWLVFRKMVVDAGDTWPAWNMSQRWTEARPASDGGSRRVSGCFSATYQLMAFDSQRRTSPSTSAGTFPIGFSAR